MPHLSLGVVGSSGKPDEHRLAIHPDHLERIDRELRARMYLERGYARRFGVPDERLEAQCAGLRSREDLLEECDVLLLPKPVHDDLRRLPEGRVLWGWPHCVQDEVLTQIAIDRRQTLIAWEAMNYWTADSAFSLHVFHKNNEMAGYCSVMHALELTGTTGAYGRRLSAAVISFGATARGAITALLALGIHDITVLTHRNIPAVAAPMSPARLVHYERDATHPHRAVAIDSHGRRPIAEFLAGHDLVVNCILQDTDDPLMFVTDDELGMFPAGAVIVDVSCDEGMGFEWARATSFAEPMLAVGDEVHYYAVDHSPSYFWNSSTWEISEALIPFLPVVMAGPGAWEQDETIRRAIEIRDGVIQDDKILSFQGRTAEYPHPRR
jgi:alanine dehydrogenase